MEYRVKILRYDPRKDEFPYFEEYRYETDETKSVLEALMEIRNVQDCSLSFRYSCRESICGSCAMVINGQFGLACRTELESLDAPEVLIEPLPNLEIQKDLVVDLDPFWEALVKIGAFLHSEGEVPETGHRIDDEKIDKIFQYVNCILCGCCYSVCPVVSMREYYLGPAALAKLYRFVKDPRDKRPYKNWSRVNTEGGAWGCHTIFKCNDVCPKDVRPADGIEALRRTLIVEKIKNLWPFKR